MTDKMFVEQRAEGGYAVRKPRNPHAAHCRVV
jgi:hypothetical protein